MKNIIVFGAAGRTGNYIVRAALEAGYKVTAYIHDKPLNIRHDRLEIVSGDTYDEDEVMAAIKGKDVVISAIGTKQLEGDAVNLMSDAMKIFVKGMERHGVKRIFGIGGRGVLQYDEHTQLIDRPDYSPMYKNIGIGHNKAYLVLRDSGLDWTFICCPDIIDAPATGHYNLKRNYPPQGEFRINTGDIADFIVKEIESGDFLRTRVGICNYK